MSSVLQESISMGTFYFRKEKKNAHFFLGQRTVELAGMLLFFTLKGLAFLLQV